MASLTMGNSSDQLSKAMAAMNVSNAAKGNDKTTGVFYDHSSGKRINSNAVFVEALSKQYPNLELLVTPADSLDLNGYANAGHASLEEVEDQPGSLPSSVQWEVYRAPARRAGGALGSLAVAQKLAKYLYKWHDNDFIVYLIEGQEGPWPLPLYYILSTEKAKAQQLILEIGRWSTDLHNEIWEYDDGMWQKSAALYESVKNSSWDVVILDPAMKEAIIEDHLSFYRSRETYSRLKVPWKRGIIYYGPPGNGKTISIKATMNMLLKLDPPVTPLYVRTLASWAGPEYSLQVIFEQARRFAPSYLVFEDLDSVINPSVRSYFLNEVDGLKNNDGVFMIGSTNHLDLLDPGIAKRPSRFDRKYLYPDPDLEQRVLYAQFWQKKLADNKEIEFPDELCRAIAGITDKFSFAYIQEAFVASLLAIARRDEDEDLTNRVSTPELADEWVDVVSKPEVKKDLDKLMLWVEMKRQVALLREGLEDD
ncbi:ATPase [Paramyrothecium foliicola]|nr:ATPase [Paramyrothecium foliicola]